MEENLNRRNDIKRILNSRLKLISLSYMGMRSDIKKISIEEILQNFSSQESIPNSEAFSLFDFNNVRERISNSKRSDEFKAIQISRVNDLEDEFKKFKNILLNMRKMKSEINEIYVCGKYKNLKLVYSRDVNKIKEYNNKIKKIKNSINQEKFGEGITACIDSFSYKIRGEFKRHEIDENEQVEHFLNKCFSQFQNLNSYIDGIRINCEYVVDLSSEVLKDRKFINNLSNMKLEDEDINLIKEYSTLN